MLSGKFDYRVKFQLQILGSGGWINLQDFLKSILL